MRFVCGFGDLDHKKISRKRRVVYVTQDERSHFLFVAKTRVVPRIRFIRPS